MPRTLFAFVLCLSALLLGCKPGSNRSNDESKATKDSKTESSTRESVLGRWEATEATLAEYGYRDFEFRQDGTMHMHMLNRDGSLLETEGTHGFADDYFFFAFVKRGKQYRVQCKIKSVSEDTLVLQSPTTISKTLEFKKKK
jgi:hypothetical protein